MSDWLHIEVRLTGNRRLALDPPPGRVLLCHVEHTFADLADGIDTAFGRWDPVHIHEFEVDGRTFVGGALDDEGDDATIYTEDVALDELKGRPGLTFRYLFDPGEGWTHDCEVVATDVEVDPDDELDDVVPVYGWGSIPDQYGRDVPEDFDDEIDDEDDSDDDLDPAEAWAVVDAALALPDDDPPEAELGVAAAALRAPHADERLALVRDAADLRVTSNDDAELWLEAAAAIVAPTGPFGLEPASREGWEAIEHADWAGAVIELVRGGPGTAGDPDSLQELIAQCPEVEESDLDPDEQAVLRRGLDFVGDLLQAIGALDSSRRLTSLGEWGLPRALRRAWLE